MASLYQSCYDSKVWSTTVHLTLNALSGPTVERKPTERKKMQMNLIVIDPTCTGIGCQLHLIGLLLMKTLETVNVNVYSQIFGN